MKTAYYCSSDAFCPDCKETGGEYCVPLEYHCCIGDAPCPTPDKNCMVRRTQP